MLALQPGSIMTSFEVTWTRTLTLRRSTKEIFKSKQVELIRCLGLLIKQWGSKYWKSEIRNHLNTVGARIPSMFGFRMVDKVWFSNGVQFSNGQPFFVRLSNGPDHPNTELWLV